MSIKGRQTLPSAVQALAAAASGNDPLTEAVIQPLAGGTTLIDLMKLDVMRPGALVDINPLAGGWSKIELQRRKPAAWLDGADVGCGR